MKRLLNLFCLILSITFCHCDEDQPCLGETWKLLLQESNDIDRINNLNFEQSIQLFSSNLDIDTFEPASTNDSLLSILDDYQHHKSNYNRSVIVFWHVKDFYHYDYNEILKRNFLFVGEETTIENHTISDANKNVAKNHQNNEITEKQRSVRLVSSNSLNYPALYDYIVNYKRQNTLQPEPKYEDLARLCEFVNVIMCMADNDTTGIFDSLLYKIIAKQNCDYLKTDAMTLAVLAPEPFEISEPLYPTTIFYDKEYLSPETRDLFKNSFAWPQLKIKMLELALSKFMEMNDWSSVVIISDNSPTNREFERNLIIKFNNEGMIYTSRFCNVSSCDFAEMLRGLTAYNTIIIVANFGEEYVSCLTEQLSNMQLEHKPVWLFLEWSQHGAFAAAKGRIGEVFSVTLGPENTEKSYREEISFKAMYSLINGANWDDSHGYFTEDVSYVKKNLLKKTNSVHSTLSTAIINKLKQRMVTEYSVETGGEGVKAYLTWYRSNLTKTSVARVTILHHTPLLSYSDLIKDYVEDIQLPEFRRRINGQTNRLL